MAKGINTTADEGQTPIATIGCGFDVAHAMRGEGFDASEDGTGRGTPLVPVCFDTTQITSPGNYSQPRAGEPCHPLAAGAHPPAIAFPAEMSATQHASTDELSPALSVKHTTAVAFQTRIARNGRGYSEGVASALNGADAGATSDMRPCVAVAQNTTWQVRRLTPTECERLQGFPDGWTQVPYRGKPAADGPRYKALGNSMAVNVMRRIGRRIEYVERLMAERGER